MKSILILFVLLTNIAFSQEKMYWKKGFEYLYEATYMDINGDTLSFENIKVEVTDSIFNYNQTLLYYSYSLENIELKEKIDSILGFKNEWVKRMGEGALEVNQLWIHPFRSNQYVFTEIAPFPKIALPPALNIRGKSKTKIFSIFGNFRGTVKSTSEITAKETRTYFWGTELDCWKVESVGKHSKLGKSYLTLYFKENIGLLEMNYVFYNGEKMNFKLIQTKK